MPVHMLVKRGTSCHVALAFATSRNAFLDSAVVVDKDVEFRVANGNCERGRSAMSFWRWVAPGLVTFWALKAVVRLVLLEKVSQSASYSAKTVGRESSEP